MADSVVKLRVDSQEYDAKIKRAADGLRAFGENCRKAGESVTKADKNTLDYVRSIGQMETVSKTAKGKVNEMTSAFTELSVQYRNLTEQERQSPFGRALASSIDQLKTRINESKAQLSDVNAELGNTGNKSTETGGLLQQLAGKFTMNIDVLKLFNIGLQAGSAALGVAKDAFFASEATVDEWGRIVDSSRSLYEGFLNSINNGDISGFLGRIDQIVSAARAAYNELDRLGTMRTIQAPQISAQQTENERMRMMIQTGRYIAPSDGRKAAMANGQVLTPEQIRNIEKHLQNGVQNVVTLVGNEVKQTGKAIEAVYTRQGAELGMSVEEFKKGTSSMAEFDKRVQGAERLNRWIADNTTIDLQTGREIRPRGIPKELRQYKGWDVFRVDGERYNDLVKLIQQRDQQAAQAYSMQGQAYRTINRAEGITTRSIMQGGGSGGGGGRTTTTGGRTGGVKVELPPTGSIAEQEAKVQALTKAWRNATDAAGREGYAAQLEAAKKALDEMQGKKVEVVAPGSLKDLNSQIRDLQTKREQLADPVQINVIDDQIAKLKKDIDALNSGDVMYFSLKVQEDELTTRLNDLTEKRKLLEDPMAIRIVNDDIKRVQAELDEANKKKIETKAEIDTSQLETQIADLYKLRDQIGQPIAIDVVVNDISDVERQIADVQKMRADQEQPKRPATITLEQKVSLSMAEEKINADMQTLTNLLRVKLENGLEDIDINTEGIQQAIFGEGMDIPDEYWEDLTKQINEKLKDLGIDPITLDVQTGNVSKEERQDRRSPMETVRTAMGGISQIAGGLNQMGVKLPESINKGISVLQGVITVIEGVQTVISLFSTGSQALNTAAVTANTIAVGALTTALMANTATNFIPFFNTGGIAHAAGGLLTGHHYSGDQVPVMVNDGELILNRAQQGVIADTLRGGDVPVIEIEGVIDGENLRLVQRNSNRRRGRGEYVTSKNR